MRLLRVLESLAGVLERLSRQLVPGLMILLSMMYRRGAMRMGGKFVEFGGSLVRIAGHGCYLNLNFSSLGTFASATGPPIATPCL